MTTPAKRPDQVEPINDVEDVVDLVWSILDGRRAKRQGELLTPDELQDLGMALLSVSDAAYSEANGNMVTRRRNLDAAKDYLERFYMRRG